MVLGWKMVLVLLSVFFMIVFVIMIIFLVELVNFLMIKWIIWWRLVFLFWKSFEMLKKRVVVLFVGNDFFV